MSTFDISQIDIDGLEESKAAELIAKHAEALKNSQQEIVLNHSLHSFGGLLEGKVQLSLHCWTT